MPSDKGKTSSNHHDGPKNYLKESSLRNSSTATDSTSSNDKNLEGIELDVELT
jgi:hypothetical protein